MMRWILKLTGGLFGLFFLLTLIIFWNTLRLPNLPASIETKLSPPAGLDAAVKRLSAAIQIPTVSYGGGKPIDADSFAALHALLATSYPLTHAALKREVIGGWSLLYTWPGSDPSLPPILLTAHQDVVPVEPGTEGNWTHPPFSGAVAEGFVWGRGALDNKHMLMATLEGVERLTTFHATVLLLLTVGKKT